MQTREKAILSSGGYLLAAVLWFTTASGTLNQVQTKAAELDTKQKEHTELSIKLKDKARLIKEHQQLEADIVQLRSSVPKNPDTDILIIDLEKMCLDSGLELVSAEEPDKEKLKATEASEQALMPAKPKVSGAVSTGPGAKPAAKPPGAGDKGKQAVDTGLAKHYLQVTTQGSYAGCVELMKKLDAYERVLRISQIDVGFPSEGAGKDKKPDSSQLKISFLVTAYCLP